MLTLKRSGDGYIPAQFRACGLSATTVHGIHTTLHHALKAAVEQGLLPTNPAAEVNPPKVEEAPMYILNDDQLNTFMTAIESDSIWHDFFYVEMTTGLRLGEICGLMWSDFDAGKGTLSISRTLHKEKGGRLVAGDTKTYAGTRKIVLPTSTTELLKTRKRYSYSPWIFHDPLHPEAPVNPGSAYRQLKKILKANSLPGLRFHDLRRPNVNSKTQNIFCVKNSSTPMHPQSPTKYMKRFGQKYKVTHFHPHKLRHSFASIAILNGADIASVSQKLGHSDAAITLKVYTHTNEEGIKRASDIFREALKQTPQNYQTESNNPGHKENLCPGSFLSKGEK